MLNIFHRQPEQTVVHDQLICLDDTHLHNSPIQNMIGLEINHHWVDVTQDGSIYNVRIDEDNSLVAADLTQAEARSFIEQMIGLEASGS